MFNRQIDYLIEENIMGNPCPNKSGFAIQYWLHDTPHYSTDIRAAWVIEKYLLYYISIHGPDEFVNTWQAIFWSSNTEERVGQGESENAAMAICLAALKAKGINV